MSACHTWVAWAPATAPRAANDIWPSETWPAHPVRTTNEMVTIENTTTAVAFSRLPGPRRFGSAIKAAVVAAATSQRTACTWRSDTNEVGRARASSASRHVDTCSLMRRAGFARRRSRHATITSAYTGATSPGLRGWFHTTPASRSPRLTADAVTAPMSVRPPRTRAVRAARSALRLSAEPTPSPRMPVRRMSPENERMAAVAHTIVWSPSTPMPRRRARSARSALALMAMPMWVKRRAAARARRMAGATMAATTWSAENTSGLTVKWRSIGACSCSVAGVLCHHDGMKRLAAARSCAKPIVATISTRRGARRKRRMMTSSTTQPSAIAATRPTGTAMNQLTPP